jgi:hypothetical protein
VVDKAKDGCQEELEEETTSKALAIELWVATMEVDIVGYWKEMISREKKLVANKFDHVGEIQDTTSMKGKKNVSLCQYHISHFTLSCCCSLVTLVTRVSNRKKDLPTG